MRKALTVLLLTAAITLPFMFFDILPDIGDPASAPNSHVSDYYIEHAIDECNSPNMVTAVIVDYRAFDTMFETTVMFLAGVAVILILAYHPKRRLIVPTRFRRFDRRTGAPMYNTVNKDVMVSIIQSLILIYAAYVLFHGEGPPVLLPEAQEKEYDGDLHYIHADQLFHVIIAHYHSRCSQ